MGSIRKLFSQGLTQQKVAVESAEAAWQKAQTALGAAAEQKNSLGMQLQSTTRQVEVLTLKLAELTADGKQVAARQVELGQISMSWEAAKAGLQEIEKALAAFGGDPRDEVARLEKQLHAADDAAAKALAEESREEGRLENLSVQGPYSALASVAAPVEATERHAFCNASPGNASEGFSLATALSPDMCGRSWPKPLSRSRTFPAVSGSRSTSRPAWRWRRCWRGRRRRRETNRLLIFISMIIMHEWKP